jgi:membrane protease YdiL (CAAX protease family)
MKKLRIKLPVLYCILAYLLWFLAQNVFGAFGFFLCAALNYSNTFLAQLIGEIGAILMVIFLLRRTDRLQLLKDKGIGFVKALLFGIVPIAFLCIASLISIDFKTAKLNGPLTIIILVLGVLAIGMAEDFLCRAVMAETLLEHFGTGRKGILKAMLISALIFALTHFSNLTTSGFSGVLLQVINAFFVGILFAALYFRTGNIMIAAFVHALWDFFGLIQSENGLLASDTSLDKLISSYKLEPSIILTFVMIAVYVFILMRFSCFDNAVQKYFGSYCVKLEEEKAGKN